MIKKILFMPFLALFMLTAQPVLAEMNTSKAHDSSCQCGVDNAHRHNDRCHCRYMKMMADKLNLTEEQKEKIKAIKDKGMAKLKSDHEKMKQVRHDLKALVKSDKVDENKLDKLINQKKELLGTMMKTKYMMKHEIYQVLTPEQKEKYSQMMEQWKEKKMQDDE